MQDRFPDIEPEKLDLEEFEAMFSDRLQAYEDRLAEKNGSVPFCVSVKIKRLGQ